MSQRKIERVIAELRAGGKPFAIATVVRTVAPTSAKAGDRAVFDGEKITGGWVGGGCALPAVRKNATAALEEKRPRLIRVSRELDDIEAGIIGHPMSCPSGGTIDIFIEPVMPKKRLTIVGKTATAQALCRLAAALDYDVTVAAPGADRDDFADADQWLDEIDEVASLEPLADAIVVATQGGGDAKGLAAALETGVGYIGFVASPKKGARLKESMLQRGFAAEAVDRIKAPAGLDIGARSPEEIALSILAEIIERSGTSATETDGKHEHCEAG
jgi:xanthine dehydrogenase accessory factor